MVIYQTNSQKLQLFTYYSKLLLERADASEIKLDWPFISRRPDYELEIKLYPDEHYRMERPLPDMNFIHREMKK